MGTEPSLWLTVANVGQTDAIVRQIGGDIARRFDTRWIEPGLRAGLQPLQKPVRLKSGERHLFTITGEAELGAYELVDVERGTHELCLVGEIQYADQRGAIRHTGFFRYYDPDTGDYYKPRQQSEFDYEE